MASLFASLSKEIFQILKGSGRILSLYDEYGNKVFDPESAVSFFAEPDKLMLNIESNNADSALNVYLSDSTNASEMSKLLDLLRKIATRYNMLFNVRKYGKTLEPKDFAFKALPVTEDVENVMESMWGSTKTSYQRIGNTRLIIRHSDRISEEVRGARSRKIHSIFVETADGERFKFPVPNLHGARAYASHLSSGGSHQDELAEMIISECDTQEKFQKVRKYLRKLPEQTDYTTNLNEILTQAQLESKNKVSRLKGKRFYNNVLETIQTDRNILGPMDAEITKEIINLSEQLCLAESDPLYALLPVVARTVLETNIMDHINFEEEQMSPTFVCEHDTIMSQLIEAFVDEFGLEENNHFMRHGNNVVMLDANIVEQTQIFAEGLDGLTLQEAPQDKFLAYAKQWLQKRMVDAGMSASEMTDLDGQAQHLAAGLKDVIAGRLEPKISARELPRFTSMAAEVGYKLDLLGEPGAGIQNDVLANFISTISYKISNGESIDSNERFFASKLADIVDAAVVSETVLPEEHELEAWLDTFIVDEARGPNPYEMGDDEIYGDRIDLSEIGMEKALDDFDFAHYLTDYGSDFDGINSGDFAKLDADDRTYSRNYIKDSVTSYIANLIGVTTDQIASWEYGIDSLVDEEVIPSLTQIGFIINDMNEALDYAAFNENFDESNKLPKDLRNRVINLLNDIDLDDYYGLVSGDDADDDAYALALTLMRHLRDEAEAVGVDFLDHVDEIAKLAYAIMTKNGTIEEAGNYPDDYNAGRDPNAAPDSSEEESNLLYVAREEIEKLIYGQDNIIGHLSDSSFRDPDEDPALIIDDVADDVASSAAKRAARSSDEYWAEEFLFDKETFAYLKKLAAIELRKHFKLNVEEDLNEYDQRQVNSINMHMIADKLGEILRNSEVGPQEDVYVDNIIAALRDDFSYSLQYTQAINANEGSIRNRIEQFYKSEAQAGPVAECDVIPGDDGDQFVKDVTYVDHQELERIARLKRLAGL